jgi:hypothetical protein
LSLLKPSNQAQTTGSQIQCTTYMRHERISSPFTPFFLLWRGSWCWLSRYMCARSKIFTILLF